jgi:hypothetical protein
MKSIILTIVSVIAISVSAKTQSINNLTSIWYNTFYTQSGGFGRAIIDNNDLVISGASWPSWPSGTTDQMVTKIGPSGNIIFQTVRTPGGDHDGYQSVVKLLNGNYGFFGQQNAQGTQYFDGFYTEYNTSGTEVSYNFFSIPGSSSGSDMLMLPNGNRIYTGNHGGGQNYIALTDASFNLLNYQTFYVGGWNFAQLGIDHANNFVYAIGSELSTSAIQVVKYDLSLNYITTFTINNTEAIFNYDIKMDGSDLLLCGFKVVGGMRFGTFYRMNMSGIITDSFIAQNNSEFTAIEKYGNQILLAKSNLVGTSSTLNEILSYSGSGNTNASLPLNASSPFVPFDLVLNGDTIYAVGAQGVGHWIGIPAVEKILIGSNSYGCTNNEACNFNPSATQDDGTCTFPNQSYLNCDGGCNNDSNGNGICDEIESSITATTTVPAGISYQAVARNTQGQPLSDASVQVRFTLLTDSLTGAAEYSESHSLTTNSLGLFTTAFGAGTPQSGTFAGINWAAGSKYLKVELDAGDGFVEIGTQQLLSVPYSMRSNTSAKAGTIENAGLPVYADNAAALAGGLQAGQMYRTQSGVLMIVY